MTVLFYLCIWTTDLLYVLFLSYQLSMFVTRCLYAFILMAISVSQRGNYPLITELADGHNFSTMPDIKSVLQTLQTMRAPSTMQILWSCCFFFFFVLLFLKQISLKYHWKLGNNQGISSHCWGLIHILQTIEWPVGKTRGLNTGPAFVYADFTKKVFELLILGAGSPAHRRQHFLSAMMAARRRSSSYGE